MATLTQWEQSLVTMGPDLCGVNAPRFLCAGAAYDVRAQMVTGETFANAQARVLKNPRHSQQLDRAQQLVAFQQLTGP